MTYSAEIRFLVTFGLPLLLLLSPHVGQTAPPLDETTKRELFERYVRPVLVEHCYECHSQENGESSGELLLDSREASRRGGTRGPAVVPGNVEESLLVHAIEYDDPDLQMPPQGKLDDQQIKILTEWVRFGAPDPRDENAETTAADKPTFSAGDHWAFHVPRPPEFEGPIPADAADPLDALIERRAIEAGVEPAASAEKTVLVRRIYFDLLGVPPSHQELQRVKNDRRPDAISRLVDRLLADPRFGERWGRHWMDVARYADTIGYALAGVEKKIKGSHRYRDWILENVNRDTPYDRFVRLQIAADQISDNPADKDALGLLTIGRRFINNRQLIIDDQIDVVTRGLMGLTVACARCHDHKFDPIPTVDYYALYGVFNSTERVDEESEYPLAVTDSEKPRDHPILVRGNRANRGPIAQRQFLTVLRSKDDSLYRDGSGRRQLAEAITRPNNPLTYRVWVNRVWGQMLGTFLVDTPSDFGVQCPQPLQQDVLDELTVSFVDAGCSTKRLVRRIANSATYARQSAPPSAGRRDPENQYFARANLRRRDFESLRDSLLAVTGDLDSTMFGPSQRIEQNPPRPRRTVYAYLDRQDIPGVLRVFDVASPDTHSPQRYYTTVPQQALFLMNGQFVSDQARRVNKTIAHQNPTLDDEEFVDEAFKRILGRLPSGQERTMAGQFLQQQSRSEDRPVNPVAAWRYGIGEVDEARRVERFRPLPVFRDSRWQGPEKLPDPEYGWTSLSAEGGHPGSGLRQAAVRRWLAPAAGKVSINGYVSHPSKKGNGVRLSIVADGQVRRTMQPKGNRFPYKNVRFDVKAGDVIDFVADDNGDTSHDSFEWSIAIHLDTEDGRRLDFDSTNDFTSQPLDELLEPLSRREQLAQALMLSNEFIFIE